MVKLPRNLSGDELGKLLARYGYKFDRQKGSHMVYETMQNGEHQVCVPRSKPIPVGTLSDIVRDIAGHLDVDAGEIRAALFGL